MLYDLSQALVRSVHSVATSPPPNQQGFKTTSASLIDTLCGISLPGDAADVSYAVADDSRSVLPAAVDLNTSHSSQSVVSYPHYVVPSPSYLSPTGPTETAALRELQAFAGQSGIDHVSIQSPDTTDSVGSEGCAENSGIGQSTSCVATDISIRGLKESPSSSSLSICTTCGRGCGCQKQTEDTVYRRVSQEATSSLHSGSGKVESKFCILDTYDCKCAPQSSSPSAFLLSSSASVQQQQSRYSDVMTDEALFSTPLELSITLRELSVAAREPSTGNIADLIEHTLSLIHI